MSLSLLIHKICRGLNSSAIRSRRQWRSVEPCEVRVLLDGNIGISPTYPPGYTPTDPSIVFPNLEPPFITLSPPPSLTPPIYTPTDPSTVFADPVFPLPPLPLPQATSPPPTTTPSPPTNSPEPVSPEQPEPLDLDFYSPDPEPTTTITIPNLNLNLGGGFNTATQIETGSDPTLTQQLFWVGGNLVIQVGGNVNTTGGLGVTGGVGVTF